MREKMHAVRHGAGEGSGMAPTAQAEPLEPRRLLAGIESGILVARGTAGDDTISVRRSGGDDVIVTTNGAEQTFDMDAFTGVRLEGLAGSDTFNLIDPLVSPVVRNTTVLGGAGNDTIDYSTRTAALDFVTDPNGSRMTSGVQTDLFDDVETVIGGSGNDAFAYRNGFELPEEEQDLRFDFRLEGRGGDDRFISGLVSTISRDVGVTVFGGDGNDYFEQDDLGARVFAEGGNDTINVLSREANYAGVIDGGAGVDLIIGAGGNRDRLDLREYPGVDNASMDDFAGTVIGTESANRIDTTGSSAVTIIGNGGADTLIGSNSDDSIVGGWGDDSIDAGGGNDTVDGGPGDNTIVNAEVQPGAGSIGRVGRTLIADGSWGQDEITIERVGGDNVIVRVNQTSREFDMDDFDAVLLRGNAGFDVMRVLDPLIAGSLIRPITLQGGNGNDVLFGSDGPSNELLDGGEHHDTLDALDGFGGDTVIGGNGNDTARADVGDTTSGVEA